MEPINTISSRTVVLPEADIDTDQIIPARFLTTTSRDGLGKCCFADWRFTADGKLNSDCILNRPESAGCAILIAGHNFGCGSSREHAPWALLDFGFRAVVSTQVADIFRANAARNGLLPIIVDHTTHRWLLDHPGAPVTISLESRTLSAESGPSTTFHFDAFARTCLLRGVDELGFILSHSLDIGLFEGMHA